MQPPASFRALADPIYESYYGLTDQPFAITTDPKFFYLSNAHQRAYGELLNGLRRREGVLLVTGETGTGKTTMCRAVLEALGSRTFSSLVVNPYLTAAEVLRIVLRDFGLVSSADLRRGRAGEADTAQLVDTLEGFLRSLVKIDSQAVIVLDEAQSLSADVLDHIRQLTAFEHDNRRLVGIVLCGQPTLLDTLASDQLRALNERITRRVTLAPLAAHEVESYIQHRLAIVGGTQVTFAPDAAAEVAGLSGGLPRRVNVVCDRALQEGRIDGVNVITADLVRRAARSIGLVEVPVPVAVSSSAAAASSEPPPAASTGPSLVLGQLAERAPARNLTPFAAAGAAAALLVAGYTYWAESTLGNVPVVAVPAPSIVPTVPAASALPPPPDTEFLRLLTPRPRPRPAPVVDPAAEIDMPPPVFTP